MNRTKILVALPLSHPELPSLDQVLDGTSPCSGTIGPLVRLVSFLAEAGFQSYLSSASENYDSRLPCIVHESVKAREFQLLVLNQTHWNGTTLTFGNEALPRTILWLQNQTPWAFTHTFLNKGGYRVVCPSFYHANIYRALPQWRNKITVVYNSICPVFEPVAGVEPKKRLLFVGAITPSKGFTELMEVWSYLVQKGADLQLAIAGSISLHADSSVRVGALGVAERAFEADRIQPWLETLPENYRPQFFGALSPIELRKEISESWAVVVNPSWDSPETFCLAAVEAQACDRTVFSVAAGGLKETVYQGDFESLAKEKGMASLGERILDGLSKMDAVERNGRLAGEFVRSKFSQQLIHDSWLRLISGEGSPSKLPTTWSSTSDLVKDLLR
jgi:glycosyltransferase involved in cell wall biosynthesis